MRRAAVLLVVALVVTGCQTTQDLSAQRAKKAKKLVNLSRPPGLKIATPSRTVKVAATDVIADPNGTAAVVELRNTGASETGLPIAIAVADKAGKKVYSNDVPGLEPSLTSLPYLRKGQHAFWVNNQIPATGTAKTVKAVVGAGKGAPAGKVPAFTISRVKLTSDSSGAVLRGYIANRSKVEQKRLVISAVGRRGGKLVAAGRAIVDRLSAKGAKPQIFRIYFIGNPKGARLTLFAPPTVLR